MKKELKEIVVYEQSVFGRILMYVQDDLLATTIRRLTGKTTIDDNDVQALEVLGHKVTVLKLPARK